MKSAVPSFRPLLASIMARRDLRATDKVLHAYLVDRIGNNGNCWPGQRAISIDCGMSRDTVNASTERLKRAGLIAIDKGGPHQTNRYRLIEAGGPESRPPNAVVGGPESRPGRSGEQAIGGPESRPDTLQPTPINTPAPETSKKPKKPKPKKPDTTKREQEAEAVVRDYIAKIKRPGDYCTKDARRNVAKLLKRGVSSDDLMVCAHNYAVEKQDKIGTEFVRTVSNFYGTAAHYEAYLPGWTPPETAPSDPDDAHARKSYARAIERDSQAAQQPAQEGIGQ